MTNFKLVIVGCSAGGVTAIQKLLERLSPELSIPIVVVQHLPADSKIDPNLVFGRCTRRTILEAGDKTMIEADNVYFAAPGYHLLIERDLTFSLSQDEPVHFARPSIDVSFESASAALGADVCGILLTGANSDGAAGLHEISKYGGYTLVQDPKTAESPAMPAAALQLFTPSFVGSIDQIAEKISQIGSGVLS